MKKPTKKSNVNLGIEKRLDKIILLLESYNKLCEIAPKVDSINAENITFPEKTAQQIVKECNNEVPGGKLLYSTWLESEDFYTKEKCRPRTVKIPTEILHAGKSWNECKELIGEENMFNFAEILYMLRESESFRKLLSYENAVRYTWTSSRGSDGDLAIAGLFDADGVNSNRWRPRRSDSDVGVVIANTLI